MRNRGATLAIVAATLFVLVIIGIGIFGVLKLFGGARELQALADSGTLNLGKQMIATGVPLDATAQTVPYNYCDSWITGGNWGTPETTTVTLNGGIENTNFKVLADANGNINLQNYDRVIAQTMLVGFNAQAEGTMPAAANALTLYDQVQRTDSSLSHRLASKLSDPQIAVTMFMNTALANSLRMLGGNAAPQFAGNKYAVAYNTPGAAGNVWIDPSILPGGMTMPAAALSAQLAPNNMPFISGYIDIDTGPFTVQGTPVFPGAQPHLISLTDFHQSTTSPAITGYVAPNSFGTNCFSPNNITNASVSDESASVVGILATRFPASIPGGYIVISNWIGQTATLPTLLQELPTADQAISIAYVKQRLREILPTATDADVTAFLNTQIITADANKPTYMYLYPDPSSPLYASWHQQIMQAGVPDGTPGTLFASTVKPPTFPNGAINSQFGMLPDGNTQLWTSQHMFKWTPASGFNNFLGAFTIP